MLHHNRAGDGKGRPHEEGCWYHDQKTEQKVRTKKEVKLFPHRSEQCHVKIRQEAKEGGRAQGTNADQ